MCKGLCVYIHGFPCCVSRDDPEARSTHAAPRSWFLPTSNKRSWDSWGKWLILDVEQEIYKVILEHLVVAEKFKKCSKKKKRERKKKSHSMGSGGSNFSVEKLGKQCLGQVIKVNFSHNPLSGRNKSSALPHFSSQTPLIQPHSSHEKNFRQVPIKEHSTKCLSGTLLKTVKVKTRGSLRTCYNPNDS